MKLGFQLFFFASLLRHLIFERCEGKDKAGLAKTKGKSCLGI